MDNARPMLSKSDFSLARTCPTKLYYRKNGYPTALHGNEYLEMLADGGYMIEKIAQLCYPEGVEVTGTTIQALNRTRTLLEQEFVTIFQGAIASKGKIARVDILVKEASRLSLIEVKSKSFSSEEFRAAGEDVFAYFGIKDWTEYVEDVAFQKAVLSECYPNTQISTSLLLPDKTKSVDVDGMIGWFELSRRTETNGFDKPEIRFTGDEQTVRDNNFLTLVPIDTIVDSLLPTLLPDISRLARSVLEGERISPTQSIACKECEFRLHDTASPQNGFAECWGDSAFNSPHILELARLGQFNRNGQIDELIRNGKSSIRDIPLEVLRGKYGNRSYYQATVENELLLEGMEREIRDAEYPLHFIDFETSQMAVPYHARMHPYGKVLFQWSCHTIERAGDAPRHGEWINATDACPNIDFGKSLMETLGDRGTILTWSAYERTQLRSLAQFIEVNDVGESQLLDWIHRVVSDTSGRIVDMEKLAMKYYFHPAMGGRTSIKVTLPAVLAATTSGKIRDLLEDVGLLAFNEDGTIDNPYSHLPKLEIIDAAESVKDGTGAMRAYQEMIYGAAHADAAQKRAYRNALLRYCRLDTLAMVIIWEHWNDLLAAGMVSTAPM